MLVSLILVFREAMEAGLIIGIVLAASEGVTGRGRFIAGGIAAGVAGAALVAVFAGALSNAFAGAGQEAFTASILIFAVLMLSWHILWMSQHGRAMAVEFKALGSAVRLGQKSLLALAAVIAVAVLREGAEVVLFLFGLVAGSHTGASALVGGGLAGLALAGLMSFLLYRGLVAIPMRHLFSTTNALIALLAAGMAGQAAAVLHSADLIPGWGERLWDTSALLSDTSLIGKSLHALVGYSAQPCGVQVAAWGATLAALIIAARLIGRGPAKKTAAAAAAVVVATMVASPAARAQDMVALQFVQRHFVPDHVDVPAGGTFRRMVTSTDASALEFVWI